MKKLLLVITLITTVAFGAEPTTIKFTFTEGKPVEFSLFSQEIEALKTIQFFKDMFSSAVTDTEPVDLKMTRNTFTNIISLLSLRVNGYLLFSQGAMTPFAKTSALKELSRLNITELLDVITASDYLIIPNLFDLACESLLEKNHLIQLFKDRDALKKLETISFLHTKIKTILQQRNALLSNTIFEKGAIPTTTIPNISQSAALFIQLSNDGEKAALRLNNNAIGIFDTTTGRLLSTLKERVVLAIKVRFSNNGQRVATYLNRPVNVQINPAHQQGILDFAQQNPGQPIVLQPNQVNVAPAGGGSILKIWDIVTGSLIQEFLMPENTERIQRTLFSPDDKTVLLIGDHTIYKYRIDTQTVTSFNIVSQEGVLRPIILSQDGTIALVKNGTTIEAYDVNTENKVGQLEHVNTASKITVLSYNGRLVADAASDGTIVVFDLETQSILARVIADADIDRMLFSDDGKQLAVLTNDKTITVWRLADETPVVRIQTGEGNTSRRGNFMRFSTDGTVLLTHANKLNHVKMTLLNNNSIRSTAQVDAGWDIKNITRSKNANVFMVLKTKFTTGEAFIWSLDPIITSLDSISRMSVIQQLAVTALLNIDDPKSISQETLDTIMPLLEGVNPNIRQIVMQPFEKNQQAEDQPAAESLVQRFKKWFKRNQNQ